jgi:hypothetical protein
VLILVADSIVAGWCTAIHASSLIFLLIASGIRLVAHLTGAGAPRYTSQFRLR